MWHGQIEGLCKDFMVLAPDLPGFGRSECPRKPLSMEMFADELVHLLDQLEIVAPVTLAGLSMGGYILWQCWRRHASRIGRLILCDTRAAEDTDEVAANRARTATRVRAEGTEFLADAMVPQLFAPRTGDRHPELIAATQQIIRTTSPDTIADALQAMAQRQDATDLLAKIHQPTLLICGADDVLTPPTEMAMIADAMPDARLVSVPHCGHLSPLEDPGMVNRAIRDFLRG